MMLDFYVITCYCISSTGSAHVIILFQWESFKISSLHLRIFAKANHLKKTYETGLNDHWTSGSIKNDF